MPARVRRLHQSYYLPSMTGIATAIYESEVEGAPCQHTAEYLEFCRRQFGRCRRLIRNASVYNWSVVSKRTA